ncbi:2-polyprenyl-6-methoxyphenol hydroxylase-like FAD-dependent oxidoreductase [Lipingzhangella halophila]|uniref:2-polyprenyl-6-methoxyphenol hydroxylase-like FAD-dependent oxidoreductase n=1 Tax=Lipingzhangella halophila TaxID=1783352 RepID=A0A7W7REA3_9ACTN|nr:styrene monooxygenase/indole monooxygenase family protein [Lipingzhangella halophila]MBB4930409.1 2-polyprenyl-6-methoxyphenol hydroxylase-like FAD-dependent oxidoreductase [Lipingzhangella halophila]
MRKILIVGGGQAGLQLGLTLLHHEYDVTLMTARTSEEIRNGRAVSLQVQFHNALRFEHEYGLHLDEVAPDSVGTFRYAFAGADDIPAFDWTGRFNGPAQSVDERLKMSTWQEMFEERGGKVIIHPVTSSDLDAMAHMFDLVVVAAGHSGLAEMFPANHARTLHQETTYASVFAYARTSIEQPHRIEVHMLPDLGFLATIPTTSVTGPCELLLLCGPTSGPLGSWPQRIRPREHLDLMLSMLKERSTEQYERFHDAELVDARSVAVDYSQPVVRHPVATLPSGGKIMGLGDTVLVCHPHMAQDADNATKSAEIALKNILEQGDRPFDEDFMLRTFDGFWEYARFMAGHVNDALMAPAPALLELLVAANTHQEIADRYVNGFDDPSDFDEWATSEEKARDYLEKVTGSRTLQPG